MSITSYRARIFGTRHYSIALSITPTYYTSTFLAALSSFQTCKVASHDHLKLHCVLTFITMWLMKQKHY